MRALITHARAKLRGRKGQKAHRTIVDNVFATRDALYGASNDMKAEIEANQVRMLALAQRSAELDRNGRHAQTVADRLSEFFLPR